jgi:TonB family protein
MINTRTKLPAVLLVLFSFSVLPSFAAESYQETQERIKQTLATEDYEAAEKLCVAQLQLLKGQDSLEHAVALKQHADVLRRLFQFARAESEERSCTDMLTRISKRQEKPIGAGAIHTGGGPAPVVKPVTVSEPPRTAPMSLAREFLVVHGKADDDRSSGPTVVRADFDVGSSYRADLLRRVKRVWFPPRNQAARYALVKFSIHSGGELSELQLEVASKDLAYNQAALKAVRYASPVSPLPKGCPSVVEFHLPFTYNVFMGGRN